jgi:transcriptional regulator with XRE-family HTH domain
MVDAILRGPVRWVCPGEPNAVDEPTFGRALREMRQRAGLSQRELAERIGTTQSAVARMENGATQPKFCTLEKLAEALRQDLYVYVKGTEQA